tara:strand:+ start:247 stop:462 length:216 start_codon:yes stop_codon:yes gene_type:complete
MSYNPEWKDYYQYLEDLRDSGVVNMYGARPYLAEYMEEVSPNSVVSPATVLASWMKNYDALVADGVITRWE